MRRQAEIKAEQIARMIIRGMSKAGTLSLVIAFLFSFFSLSVAQQSSYYQEVFTQPRAGARVAVDDSGWHQIAWTTSGGPGACYIALDYSNDGMVWYLGEAIPINDCTHSGTSPVAENLHVRFVRMNLNTLSGTSAIRATYTGWQSNPGPTGTVTSVFGRTGDVLAHSDDYNVSQIMGAAPLFSPNFTGSPTAPNPPPRDNSNRIATTSWVTAHCSQCERGGGNPGTSGVASFNSRTGAVMPEAGDYAAFYAPIGGGGAATSVFGRRGAVVKQAGDYLVGDITGAAPLDSPKFTGAPNAPAPPIADPGSQRIANTNYVQQYVAAHTGGRGSSGITTGIVGAIARYDTTTTVGPSDLHDNGTTLTYTGSGGITAPSFHVPAGQYLLESATGALPALPGAGKNGFVSGPDGWYTSDNNGAWTKIGTGGGNQGGAVTSVFGRTGAVVRQAGDYGVADVTGAAPLSSPIFSGAPQAPNPDPLDNSQRIATTAWVKAYGGGGGGGGATSITQAAQAPRCEGTTSTTLASLTMSGLNLMQGDTVVVIVASRSPNIAINTATDNSSPTNTYTRQHYLTAGANFGSRAIFTAAIERNATSVTVNNGSNSHFTMCVAAYRGVSAIGGHAGTSVNGQVQTVQINAGTAGSLIVAGFFSHAAYGSAANVSPGTEIYRFSMNPGPGGMILCQNTSTIAPQNVPCTLTLGNAVNNSTIGVELECCSGGGRGGNVAGVSLFHGRIGAVEPLAGDYTVGMVPGAAPLESPVLTGAPKSVTPPPNDNSTNIATTAWVQANYGPPHGGGGAETGAPVVRRTASCFAQNNDALSAGTFAFNVQAGDTVLVGVQTDRSYTDTTNATHVTDNAEVSNVYTQRETRVAGAAGSRAISNLMATGPSAARSASSITVTQSQAGKFVACIAAYTGVQVFGHSTNELGTNQTNSTGTISLNIQDPGGHMFAMMGVGVVGSGPNAAVGTMIGSALTSAVRPASALACENTSTTGGDPVSCTGRLTNSVTAAMLMTAIELRPGVTTGPIEPPPETEGIQRSTAFTSVCTNKVGGGNLPISGTIEADDTVVVGIAAAGQPATLPTIADDASPSNTYTEVAPGNLGAAFSTFVLATGASGAHAATSLTIHTDWSVNYTACVAAYKRVNHLGSPFSETQTTASPNPGIVNQTTTNDNDWIVALIAVNLRQTSITQNTGQLLASQSQVGTSSVAAALCDNTSASPSTTLGCRVSVNSSSPFRVMGIGLQHAPGVVDPPPPPPPEETHLPTVVAAQTYAAGTAQGNANSPLTLCSTTVCPAGLYRVTFAIVTSTSCPGGGMTPHVHYTDESPSTQPQDIGMLASNYLFSSMSTFGERVLHSTGATPIAIHTTTVACSSGNAVGNLHMTVERLH